MLFVIMINLAFIAVIVGGWAFTVWTFYRRLESPYAAEETRRAPSARPARAAGRPRRDVRHVTHAA